MFVTNAAVFVSFSVSLVCNMNASCGMLEFSVHADTCVPSSIFRHSSSENNYKQVSKCSICKAESLVLACDVVKARE